MCSYGKFNVWFCYNMSITSYWFKLVTVDCGFETPEQKWGVQKCFQIHRSPFVVFHSAYFGYSESHSFSTSDMFEAGVYGTLRKIFFHQHVILDIQSGSKLKFKE